MACSSKTLSVRGKRQRSMCLSSLVAVSDAGKRVEQAGPVIAGAAVGLLPTRKWKRRGQDDTVEPGLRLCDGRSLSYA
jgi:hypothetical protein